MNLNKNCEDCFSTNTFKNISLRKNIDIYAAVNQLKINDSGSSYLHQLTRLR